MKPSRSTKPFHLEESFDVKMNKKLKEYPEAMSDFDCVYQFEIDDKVWNLDLTKDSPQMISGKHKKPDCTIQISEENFEKLIRGNLNFPLALITGKIKIKGAKALALQLHEILS